MCVLWAMGITQHTDGSDASTAISNLLLVTGNYMRPGTGAYPLRGHNNVQGAGDIGAAPNLFPGYQSVTDDQLRAKFEQGWGVKLPGVIAVSIITRWSKPFTKESCAPCILPAKT
jgi:formate dehydrogenase major subunit